MRIKEKAGRKRWKKWRFFFFFVKIQDLEEASIRRLGSLRGHESASREQGGCSAINLARVHLWLAPWVKNQNLSLNPNLKGRWRVADRKNRGRKRRSGSDALRRKLTLVAFRPSKQIQRNPCNLPEGTSQDPKPRRCWFIKTLLSKIKLYINLMNPKMSKLMINFNLF